ncbi:hypothetical protein DFJ73DRAFT_472420 [Zopfochytrium polystomum]|nr:hypothetical protein DFJ73DRAFT_472420 [Zopfochytrium polystomum]
MSPCTANRIIPAQPYFAPGPMNNSSRPQPNPPSNFTFAPPTGSSAKSKPPSSRFGGSSIGDPSKLEQTASLLGSASGGRGKKKKVGWFQRGNPRRRRNIGILVVVIFLVVIALCITITVLAVKKSKPAQSTIKPKAAKGSSKGLTKSAAGSTPTSRLSPSSTPAAEDGDGDGDDADGDAKSDDDKKVKGDKKKQTGGGDDTDKSDDSNEEGDDQKAGSDGGDETEQTAKKPAGGDDDDDTKPSSADPAVAPATVDPSAAPAAPGEDEADGDAGVAAEVDSAPGLGSTDFTLLAATPVRGNLFQVVSRQSGLCAEYLTATENHMVAEAAKANPKGSDAASGRGLARRESGRAAGRVAAVVSLSPCERIPVAGLSPQLFRATDDEKWMHTRSKMCLDADVSKLKVHVQFPPIRK